MRTLFTVDVIQTPPPVRVLTGRKLFGATVHPDDLMAVIRGQAFRGVACLCDSGDFL